MCMCLVKLHISGADCGGSSCTTLQTSLTSWDNIHLLSRISQSWLTSLFLFFFLCHRFPISNRYFLSQKGPWLPGPGPGWAFVSVRTRSTPTPFPVHVQQQSFFFFKVISVQYINSSPLPGANRRCLTPTLNKSPRNPVLFWSPPLPSATLWSPIQRGETLRGQNIEGCVWVRARGKEWWDASIFLLMAFRVFHTPMGPNSCISCSYSNISPLFLNICPHLFIFFFFLLCCQRLSRHGCGNYSNDNSTAVFQENTHSTL